MSRDNSAFKKKIAKGKRTRDNNDGSIIDNAPINGHCYINEIPIELLTHIFSRLEPAELNTAAQICKHWRWIITDDSCWKNALIQFFGFTPFRRLANDSWKNEYITRTKLLRKWEIGRGLVLSFDPRVGIINNLYADFANSWMLAGSLDKGMVSRSDPSTGKISKDIIFSTRENVGHNISAMLIDRHRILWGYKSGGVGLTALNKQGSNRFFKQFLDFHAGPVSILAWSTQFMNAVVSGGEDGLVNLWDVNSGRCIKSLRTDETLGDRTIITTLAWNVKKYIIAGTTNGTIYIWSMDSTIVHSSPDNSLRDKNLSHTKISGTSRVISLHYVESSNVLIVAYENSPEMKKFDLETMECICVFKNGHSGNVTRTIIDVQENSGVSNENGAKPLNILASGDTLGNVCLWNIDGSIKDGIQEPFRVFEGHLSSITAIHLDALKIIIGSLDGSVTVFDPLTSKVIRVLCQRPRRTANRATQAQDGTSAVNCIYSEDYRTVLTIGGQIKTWDYMPSSSVTGNKAKHPKKKNASSSTPKYTNKFQRLELQNDLRESTQMFALEKQEREEHLAKMQEYTPIPGLTNEEMLAYALMVSKEEYQPEDDQIAEAIKRSLEIREDHE